MARIAVGSTPANTVAPTPPIDTVAPGRKSVPVTTTKVPPAVGPAFGAIEVTAGPLHAALTCSTIAPCAAATPRTRIWKVVPAPIASDPAVGSRLVFVPPD